MRAITTTHSQGKSTEITQCPQKMEQLKLGLEITDKFGVPEAPPLSH